MALVVADRVKETTTSVGTSTINLAGAEDNFETFVAGVGTGNTTYYAIVDKGNSEFEVGVGTVTSGTPDTLSRDTVLASSNSDALVNFSTGEKDVFCTQPADKAVYLDSSGQLVIDGTSVTATATELNYVDGVTSAIQTQLDSKLNLSGGTMTGALTLSGAPTADNHATTKIYVDDLIAAGIHYHDPVRVESPDSAGSLSATYDNGTSGVGATLTNNGTQAALVIDGVTLATSDRVLIYNQTNAFENGIYTVTDTGSASTNWVLTRATDADSYGVDNQSLSEGTSIFVLEGDDGSGEVYACTTTGTITFGTTAINFSQIGKSAVITGNGGITVTGNEVSANVDATVQTTAANSVSSTASRTYAVQVDGSNDLVVNVPWVDTDTDTDTTYTAGTGLTLSGTQFSVQDNYVLNSGDSIAGQLSVTSSTYPPLEVTRDAGAVTTGNYVSLRLNTQTSGTPADGLGSMIDFYVDDVMKGRAGYTNDGDFHIKQSDGSTDSITVDSTGDVTLSNTLTTGNTSSREWVEIKSSQWPEVRLTSPTDAGGIRYGMTHTTDSTYGVTVGDGYVYGADTNSMLLIIPQDGSSLKRQAAYNTTPYTIWDSNNDGSGSGLDADTVDGIQGASFLRSDANDTATGDLTFSGKITAADPDFANQLEVYRSGGPNYSMIKYSNTAGELGKIGFSDTGEALIRLGTSTSNNTIWHSGNDGSGSGLDADTVDGYHASSFVEQLADTTSPNYQASSSRRVDPNASNPTNHHYAVMTFGNEGNVTGQLATHFQTGQPYTRGYNSSWSAWQKIWTDVNDGSGSGLDADTVDGIQGASFLRSDASDTCSGDISFTGGAGAVTITGSDIRSNRTSDWTGNPGTQGKIQYHSARWYIVSDSASDRIVQFRRDGSDKSYIDNNGKFQGTASSADNADTVDGLHAASFLRSDADDTATGIITLSKDTTDVLNFTANSTNDARGISFNSRTALSADYNDGWLRLNSSSEFTNGTYSPLKIASAQQLVGGSSSVTSGGQIALRNTTNPYLSWHENATRRAYIQYLTSDNALFIYNEEAGNLRFRGNAASVNFDFQTTGAANTGRLFVDADDFAMRFGDNESIVYGRKNSHTWLYYNGDWRLRTEDNGIRIRSPSAYTYNQMIMETNGTVRGYVYANTSNNIGFLDAGGSWAVRHINDTGTYFYTDGETEEFKVGRDTVTGNYGTVQTSSNKGGWSGYSIQGNYVFMSSGTGACGIYNDVDNEWMAYFERNSSAYLYYNGTEYLRTISGGVDVSGDLYVDDQIIHNGDTNTYMQFHAADQWRVVTGGSERLEVNNTQTTVNQNLKVNGKLVYTGLDINPNFDINNSGGVNISDAIQYLDIEAGNDTTYVENGMILDAPWTGVSTSNSRFGISVVEGSSIDASRVNVGLGAAYGDTWIVGNIEHGTGGVAAIDEGIVCAAGSNISIRSVGRVFSIDGADESVTASQYDFVGKSFIAISDKTKKENIKPLEFSSNDLQKLSAYTYNFITDENKRTKVGLIAQEVQDVLPDAVNTKTDKQTEESFLSLDYNAVVASLVSVINELTERVNELEVKTGIK